MKEIKKVIAYFRCSTNRQEASIPDQKKAVLPYIKSRGWQLLGEFADKGKSGSIDPHKRHAFHQMMNLVDSGEADAVVCLDTSRFGRQDSNEIQDEITRLRLADTLLHTVQDSEYDFNDSNHRAMFGFKAENNNGESKKISDRSLPAKVKRIKEGSVCAAGGTIAYGIAKKVYDPAGTAHVIKRGEKFQVPKQWPRPTYILGDEQEVEVVKFIFGQVLKKDVSYESIAIELNKQGIPSATGGKWRDVSIKSILRNPIYCGASFIGKSESGKFNRASGIPKYGAAKKQNQKPDVIIWDQFEAIIKKKDWQKVQKIMEDKTKNRTKPKSSGKQYPLTGILVCGGCGRKMQGHTNKQLKEGKQIRYRCGARPAPTPECSGVVKEHEILPIIIEAVKDKIGEFTAPKNIKQVKSNQRKQVSIDKKIKEKKWKLKLTKDEELYLELQEELQELRKQKAELEQTKNSFVPCSEAEALGCIELLDFICKPEILKLEKPLKLLAGTVEGFEAVNQIIINDTVIEVAVFRQKMKELGLKIEVFFKDMGAEKKYGRWILDIGRVKLDLGDIQGEYARRNVSNRGRRESSHCL